MATELTLRDLPNDILSKLLSALPMHEILHISRTSKQFNDSCKCAIKQSANIDLYLTNDHEDEFLTVLTRQIMSKSLKKVKSNQNIIHFLRNVWKNVISLNGDIYSISTVLQTLGLNPSKLQNIQFLHQPKHCVFEYLSFLPKLQWIHCPYVGKKIWNELITHCKNLRGISFEITPKYDYGHDNEEIELMEAPTLWSLSLNICGVSCPSFRGNCLINEMIQCSQNLNYFRIEGSADLSLEYFDNSTPIQLNANLIGLKVRCGAGIQKKFDLSRCEKLCYLDFELSFLTEDIEVSAYRDYHRKSSVLLLQFLEHTALHCLYCPIQIGLFLCFENGTDTVCEQEKIDSIMEFKSIMNESDIYCHFNAEQQQKNKMFVYTNYKGHLPELWTKEVFGNNVVDIYKGYHSSDVMKNIMDTTDTNEELLTYWRKMNNYEVYI